MGGRDNYEYKKKRDESIGGQFQRLDCIMSRQLQELGDGNLPMRRSM